MDYRKKFLVSNVWNHYWEHCLDSEKEIYWNFIDDIFSVMISDQVCSSILKPLIHRLRPCHEPSIQNLVHLVGNCGGQFGFCSSHAANTFALVTCLILLFSKQFNGIKYLYIWAIIVSYSRIYIGVHYPLDVLAGAGIGVLASLFCHKVYHYYH